MLPITSNNNAPENQYIRIGKAYYKNIYTYDKRGQKIKKLIKWDRQTLVDDFDKGILETIPKYDDFVNVPSHTDYQKQMDNCYNMYEEASGKVGKKGKFPTIEMFMTHIFGSQLTMGYDYVQILWQYPTQILPVLCLVSAENQTGKTTFGNFLGKIFGSNFSIIGNQELTTEFNSSYASKLIAMVDEGWITYKIIDKLKNLATSDQIMLRRMHTDHTAIGFFCKWILCSNRVNDFIVANKEDERYWVRKISKFDNFDPKFLDKIEKEVPAFLHWLTNREIVAENVSRMWFCPKSIRTEAFENVIRHSKDLATKDFTETLLEIMEQNKTQVLTASIKDLRSLPEFDRRNDMTFSKIKTILLDELELEPEKSPKSYNFLNDQMSRVGRFYTIDIDDLKEYTNTNYKLNDDDTEQQQDLPF